MKTCAPGSGGLGVGNGLAQCGGNAVAPANDADANAVFHAARGFGQQIFVQEAKDGGDLGRRALPIRGREREESQCVDAEFGSGFDDCTAGFRASAMAGGARQTA